MPLPPGLQMFWMPCFQLLHGYTDLHSPAKNYNLLHFHRTKPQRSDSYLRNCFRICSSQFHFSADSAIYKACIYINKLTAFCFHSFLQSVLWVFALPVRQWQCYIPFSVTLVFILYLPKSLTYIYNRSFIHFFNWLPDTQLSESNLEDL